MKLEAKSIPDAIEEASRIIGRPFLVGKTKDNVVAKTDIYGGSRICSVLLIKGEFFLEGWKNAKN